MDRTHFLQNMAAGSLMIGGAGQWPGSNPPPRQELLAIWRTSGTVALEFAEAMPQQDYGFRPAGLEDIYSYGEQMQHIADNNISLLQDLSGQPPPDIYLDDETNKQAIMANIRSSFDYGAQIMEGLTEEEVMQEVDFFARPLPRWHVLFVTQDHTTHHCGQAVIYLRAQGIAPPYYRKW